MATDKSENYPKLIFLGWASNLPDSLLIRVSDGMPCMLDILTQQISTIDRQNSLMLFYLTSCNVQYISSGNIVVKTKIFMSISIFRLATTLSMDGILIETKYLHMYAIQRAHVLIVLVTTSDKTVFCFPYIDRHIILYGGSYCSPEVFCCCCYICIVVQFKLVIKHKITVECKIYCHQTLKQRTLS